MTLPPDEIPTEISHQRDLLRIYLQNIRRLDNQIATLGDSHAPVGHFNQRDDFEAKRTAALARIQDLERQLGTPPLAARPTADVRLMTAVLPTGVLHLYSAADYGVVAFSLANPANDPATLFVSSWIEDLTHTRTDEVRLGPAASRTVQQVPTLKAEAVAGAHEVRKALLHTRVSRLGPVGEELLSLNDFEVRLLARDMLVWTARSGPQAWADLSYQLAAWVTPNAPAVVAVVGRAAARIPDRRLVGYQGGGTTDERAAAVRSQVQALFESVKHHDGGMAYVNAPVGFGGNPGDVPQRISLPRDSIVNRQANCVDGVVLFASLMERIGLNVVLVLVPGHAFVGWETGPSSGQYEYLETTMNDFAAACQEGQARFDRARPLVGQPLFAPAGFAVVLTLADLRARGVTPME